jgi:HEAT repeat protein
MPALLRALADRDAVVRSIAAAAVEEQMHNCQLMVGRAGGFYCPAAEVYGPITPELIVPLTSALADPDPGVRRAAAAALQAAPGDAAKPAVPALIARALGDPDADVRYFAAAALQQFGPPASAAAIRAFTAALRQAAAQERVAAATALGVAGADAEAVRALIAAVKHDAGEVSRAADTALELQGYASPDELVAALGDPNPHLQYELLRALWRAGRTAVPPLTRALGDDSPIVRERAAQAMAALTVDYAEIGLERVNELDAAGAVDALAAALRDADDSVRAAAAAALPAVAPFDPQSVTALRAALQSPHLAAQEASLLALARLGSAAGSAAPDAAAALRDESPLVRRRAAEALAAMGLAGRSARAALRQATLDSDPDVAAAAARALASVGGDAPELTDALQHEHTPLLRAAAAEALASAGANGAAVASLIAALRDEDASVRTAAARTLGVTGGASPAALPALIAALDDGEAAVRGVASDAVAAQPPVAEVRPALEALLHHHAPAVRMGSAQALAALAAPEAVPALRHALAADPDAGARAAIAAALAQNGPLGVDALCAALGDSSVAVRAAAALALEPVAGEAQIPVLVAALGDDDAAVNEAAAVTLGAIGPPAATAISELTRLVAERHSGAAAVALGRMGPAAAPAVPVLIREVETGHAYREAATALGRIGPAAAAALPVLIVAVNTGDTDAGAAATVALGRLGPRAAAAVPALARQLRELGHWDQMTASSIFIQQRVQRLGEIRTALVAIGVAGLFAALASDDAQVRADAAAAIWEVRPALAEAEVASARAALRLAARDREAKVREQAVRALGRCDAAAEITATLHDDSAAVRLQAIASLVLTARIRSAFGRPAEPGVAAALCGAVDDPEPAVRVEALQMLPGFPDTLCLAGLQRAAADADRIVRNQSVFAIAAAARRDPAALALLERLQDDPDSAVRVNANTQLAGLRAAK